MVNGSSPGPAPAAQAPASNCRLTRSSWRTWPHRKLRRKVPSVDGALITHPSTCSVPPARSASASSMQSPPARADWRWWQRLLRKCGKRRKVTASTGSSPSCPVCGGRARRVPPTQREYGVRGIGVPARIPSRAFGAMFCWGDVLLGRCSAGDAGRAGRHGEGADGTAAVGTPESFHRCAVANHAAQGERVARHQGPRARVRFGQPSIDGTRWTTGIGAGWGTSQVLKFR